MASISNRTGGLGPQFFMRVIKSSSVTTFSPAVSPGKNSVTLWRDASGAFSATSASALASSDIEPNGPAGSSGADNKS